MKWNILNAKHTLDLMASRKVSSILAKVLEFRDGHLEEEADLHDFSLFEDSQKVLKRIEKAIVNQEKICIYGDYDCDGIVATSIMVRAFEKRGVRVGYHIPDRFVDGYGLTVERVKQMAEKGYRLIITVDNGVSAYEAVEVASKLGVDVIITDHHDLPDILPPAFAIIHTRLSPRYPFKAICGGFIACKLATAMLSEQDPYIYCLAALSTVSDMMPMVDENRTLVKKALHVLNQKKYVSFSLLNGENKAFTSTSLGFTIAPKINSIGRLGEGMNPNMAVKYFVHEAPLNEVERQFKLQFVSNAGSLNRTRQQMTTQQYRHAKEMMQDVSGAKVCLDENFHEGLVGLVAGKLMNEYNVPVFTIQKGSRVYKGSCRGIDGLDMHDCLNYCKDHLLVYGGHLKAGGFSLEPGKYNEFVAALDTYFRLHLTDDLREATLSCIALVPEDITIDNVRELERLEPFGQQNEEPIFYLKLTMKPVITKLSNGQHLKLQFELPYARLDAMLFNGGEAYDRLSRQDVFHLYGTLSVNQFRNIENITLVCKEIG